MQEDRRFIEAVLYRHYFSYQSAEKNEWTLTMGRLADIMMEGGNGHESSDCFRQKGND